MKNLLVLFVVALMYVGCDKSNPIDNIVNGDVAYSEESMYKTTVSTEDELVQMRGVGSAHDSLRHGKMLGTLKRYVGLTDEQFDSVKVYAKTLFESLKEIRVQVHAGVITREEAKIAVGNARAKFVASVKLILTAEQQTKFNEWIVKFWNRHHHRRGPGGMP